MSHNAPTSRVGVTDIPIRGGGIVRLIELRRPAKLNCLSLEMLDELWLALHCEQKPACVVLTATGRSFCAGLDLTEIGGIGGGRQELAQAHLKRLADIYRWLLLTKVPTVALARGYAVGGGTGLVTGAAMAIVTGDFRLKLPGDNLAGLASVAVPFLELRSGRNPQRRWLGREFAAREAQELGLVDQVVTAERLADLLETIRRGDVLPDLLKPPARKPRDIARTLSALEEF